jgi:hypothetical protein
VFRDKVAKCNGSVFVLFSLEKSISISSEFFLFVLIYSKRIFHIGLCH